MMEATPDEMGYETLERDDTLQKEWDVLIHERKRIAEIKQSLRDERGKIELQIQEIESELAKQKNTVFEERRNFKELWLREQRKMEETQSTWNEEVKRLTAENLQIEKENESLRNKIEQLTTNDPVGPKPIVTSNIDTNPFAHVYNPFTNPSPEELRKGHGPLPSVSSHSSSPKRQRAVTSPEKRSVEKLKSLNMNLIDKAASQNTFNLGKYDIQKVIQCQRIIRKWLKKRNRGLVTPRTTLTRRKSILENLYVSEKEYIQQLEICTHFFFEPLKVETEIKHEDKPLITPAELEIIFSNFEILCSLSHEFLRGLQQKLTNYKNSDIVGDFFITMAPVMKLYSVYHRNYDKAQKLLNLKQADAYFYHFMEQLINSSGIKEKLTTYLEKPMQRLPQYPVFLQQLLENTPEEHEDYNVLVEALDKTKKVIKGINDKKREEDNSRKIREVQEMIIGLKHNKSWTGKNNLHFVSEGDWILILSTKKRTGAKCHIFLFNDFIIRTKQIKKGMYRFQEQINFREVSFNFIEELNEKDCVSQIGGFYHNALYMKMKKGTRTFILGKDKESKEKWRKLIESKCLVTGVSNKRFQDL